MRDKTLGEFPIARSEMVIAHSPKSQ